LEKKPLISVDEGPIEIWYEGPAVVVVKKPAGMPVHPEKETENGTLLNRLFQSNRWLANMETSVSAGAIHQLADLDHGLILFSKTDQWHEVLARCHREGGMQFHYLVQVKGQRVIDSKDDSDVVIIDQAEVQGNAWINLQATTGNTITLRQQLGLSHTDAVFYCYHIEFPLPQSHDRYTVSERHSGKTLPKITVFHAPP
jgi:23S rRNA-/tRNA-specific pseudouridylate synthase